MKPLIVIVEGPDRCGKGSFIEVLRDNIASSKQIAIHSGKPPSDVEDKQEWAMNYNLGLINNVNLLSRINDVIILDRSYIGEYVYGLIYRKIKYTDTMFEDFENKAIKYLLNTRHVVLVNLTDSPENVILREDGNSHKGTIITKEHEHQCFRNLHKLSIIKNKHLIDWSTETFNTTALQNLTDKILENWRND
jgi:thymidylate kinase